MKDFAAAVTVYQRIVAECPGTKEATAARTQVENLRSAVPPGTLPAAMRPPPAAVVAPPPYEVAPQLPPVLQELRQFLSTKPFVDLTKLDELIAARQSNDASAPVRQLAAAGAITQVQADAIMAEFAEHRMKHARGVVTSAQSQGLVPASHVEQAVVTYGPLVFDVSIFDHLVDSGLVTRAQADILRVPPNPIRSDERHTLNRNSYIINAVAIAVLLFAIFSNTWWSSGGYSGGLRGGETCDDDGCVAQSYDGINERLRDRGEEDVPADFAKMIYYAERTFGAGLLLLGMSCALVIAIWRHSAHVRRFALAVCGLAGVFLLLAMKAVLAARYDDTLDESYGVVLSIAASIVLVRTSIDCLRKSTQAVRAR